MTRKYTRRIKVFVASEPKQIPEPVVEVALVWSFPTRSRCPRCGSAQTRSYRVENGVQYRECLSAVCRKRYRVDGELI